MSFDSSEYRSRRWRCGPGPRCGSASDEGRGRFEDVPADCLATVRAAAASGVVDSHLKAFRDSSDSSGAGEMRGGRASKSEGVDGAEAGSSFARGEQSAGKSKHKVVERAEQAWTSDERNASLSTPEH